MFIIKLFIMLIMFEAFSLASKPTSKSLLTTIGTNINDNRDNIKLETESNDETVSNENIRRMSHKSNGLEEDEPFVFDHIEDLRVVDGIIRVFNASNALSCHLNHCLKIIKYSVNAKIKYSCREMNIPIYFKIYNKKTEKYENTRAFLLPDSGGEVQLSENTTTRCPQIKRYNINEKNVILFFNGILQGFKSEEVDKEIRWKFMWNLQFLNMFFFSIGFYDERNDSIMYFELTKIMSFYILLVITIVAIIRSITFYYKALSMIAGENCNMDEYLEKIAQKKREDSLSTKENRKSK